MSVVSAVLPPPGHISMPASPRSKVQESQMPMSADQYRGRSRSVASAVHMSPMVPLRYQAGRSPDPVWARASGAGQPTAAYGVPVAAGGGGQRKPPFSIRMRQETVAIKPMMCHSSVANPHTLS